MEISKSKNNLTVKFNISQVKPLVENILKISVSDNSCKQIFNLICYDVALNQSISSQMIVDIIKKYGDQFKKE